MFIAVKIEYSISIECNVDIMLMSEGGKACQSFLYLSDYCYIVAE